MMLAVLLACTSEPAHEREPTVSAIAPELVARTWQVQMSDASARAPHEAHRGWALLFERDLEGALRAFQDPPDQVGQTRAHLELAALYRQAARVAAEATLQVYGDDRQPTDPADVEHLVQVSRKLLAQPTDDASIVVSPDPSPRAYELLERTPEAKPVRVVDPSALYSLALWHEERAGALGRRRDGWFPGSSRSSRGSPSRARFPKPSSSGASTRCRATWTSSPTHAAGNQRSTGTRRACSLRRYGLRWSMPASTSRRSGRRPRGWKTRFVRR
jgi:hypothetical protein